MKLAGGMSLADILQGPLGMLSHPNLEHVSTEKASNFDERKFGLTAEKMKEVSDWLKSPEHQVVVVEGPTGSGKSTALPNWLMYPPKGLPQNQYLRHGQILITQPRIVATEGIAAYVGNTLMGASVGKGFDIGFGHSGSRSTDWRNSIVFRTDGQLLNLIQRDALDGLSVIMIDEAHERSVNIDLILKLLKSKLILYPNLKLIISSATIDAQMFANYFGERTAKVVSLEGKSVFGYGEPNFTDPDKALDFTDEKGLKKQVGPELVKRIKWLINEMKVGKKVTGDILGFLHGVQPIDDAVQALKSWASQDKKSKIRVEVYPLYRDLTKAEQRIIQEANENPNLIRVILSTNIAEASVTVDGVVYVVDSGVENQARWNPTVGTTEVTLVRTSKANCEQRWGRCGRNRPGEVYCLYSKEQFESELFAEYPTPEIQRSNLEGTILSAKAAGAEDVFTGWLENPPEEELKRALSVLKAKGALSKEEYLTEYGALLRYFSYPAELADLIMLADRMGCVVELATLLPFIKNGGSRFFLKWDRSWGRYKKRRAAKIHTELMRGCKDDVEFVLKVCKAYEERPWTTFHRKGRLSEKQQKELRIQWAEDNFIDYEVIEDVLYTERVDLLQRLFTRRKSDAFRNIELGLLDKVRFLLLWAFPDQHDNIIFSPNPDKYVFNPHQEKLPNSLLTVNTFCTQDALTKAQKLTGKSIFQLAQGLREVKIEDMQPKEVWERVFIEQHYPLGSNFHCKPAAKVTSNDSGKYVPVRIVRLEKLAQKKKPKGAKRAKKKKTTVPKGTHRLLNSAARLLVSESVSEKLISGEEVIATVQGYDFTEKGKPTVVLAPKDDFTSFDFFAGKNTVESEIEVEVIGISSYPMEYGRHLIVRDVDTKHEILMAISELCFGYEKDALEEIPIGIKFKVLVTSIDMKRREVKVSSLYFYQKWLDEVVEENTTRGKGITAGRVITVRSDEKITFLLDWSVPENALLVPLTADVKTLFQASGEFLLGNSYTVKFRCDSKYPSRVSLDSLPKKVYSYLGGKDESDGVFWDKEQNAICFKGRMDDLTYLELKSLDSDEVFQRAADYLFVLSNRLWVIEILDSEAIEKVRDELTNEILTVEIRGTTPYGIFVKIREGVEGFIHVREIYGYIKDATEIYSEGQIVNAQIMHFDEAEGRFELTMRIPENSPMNKYREGVGEVFPATIVNATTFGIFMRLEDGVDGLIHKSRLSFAGFVSMTVRAASQEKTTLDVRILSFEDDNGKIKIGLELA